MEIEIIDDKKIIITLENGSDDHLTAQEVVENVKYLQRSSELFAEIEKKNAHAGEADIDRYDDSDGDYDKYYYEKAYANGYADHEFDDEYDYINDPELSPRIKSLNALIDASLAGFKKKRENYLLKKCS
jgi:hypothetical protein